jgi:hypothetical protein
MMFTQINSVLDTLMMVEITIGLTCFGLLVSLVIYNKNN